MSTLLRLLAVAALSLMTALAAWSYPTIFGDTGLVQVPSADVVPYTFLDVGIDYTRVHNTQPGYAGAFNAIPARLTYGVGTGTELSFFDSFATGEGNSKYQVMGGGIKFQAIKEDPDTLMPGWAFGARTYRMEMANERDVVEGYTVFSKVLLYTGNLIDTGFAIRMHAGASYTNYSGDVKANCTSLFAGVTFKQANGISLDLDYLPSQQSDGVILQSPTASVAIRYPFNDNSCLELGMTKAFNSDQESIYGGFSVRYGNLTQVAHRQPVLE